MVPRFIRRFSVVNLSVHNSKFSESKQLHQCLCACDAREFNTFHKQQTIKKTWTRKFHVSSLFCACDAREFNTFHKQQTIKKTWTRKFHVSSLFYDDLITISSPKFAESITEGDIRWEKAIGDLVQEDEVIGEIETDKTAISVTSPGSGVITELLVSDGDTVTAEQPLVKLKLSADAPSKKESAPTPEAPKPAAPPEKPAPATPSSSGPIPSTPPPPPPIPKTPMSSTPTSSVKATPHVPSEETAGVRTETRVHMTSFHIESKERMKTTQNEYAMLTTAQECDVSNLMEMRKTFGERFKKKHGVELGYLSAFVKASAFAIRNQPVVNAVIEGNEIVYRDYIDICVAVPTSQGLVVPVIRNVQNLGYADIERTILDFSEKAKNFCLAVEDMDGGTFAINNEGVFGSIWGTSIINPPQSAVLGMHAIIPEVVEINNEAVIRPVMQLALTYDHRLIDGREAVTFLKDIKRAIEDPRVILLDL